MKILILCTGNSCRSQMAQGFLKTFDENIIVESAGTKPTGKLNPGAVKTMSEIGIDISKQTSDHVEQFIDQQWDFVITVCGGANKDCPMFTGKVKNRLHIAFEDPSDVKGTPEFVDDEFRRVRDQIKEQFYKLYVEKIRQENSCPCGANDFCKCE